MNQASHRTRRYRLFLLSETRHQDVTNTPAPSPRIWRCRHEGSGWILWVGSHSALEVSHGPRWREAARQEGKRRRKMRNNGNSSVRHCFFVKKPCHPTPQKQIAGMAFSVFFSPHPRHRILSSICTSGRAVWFSVRCRCSMLAQLPGSVMLISAIMGTTQVAKQESWRVAARWNPWDVWVLLVLRSSICLQMHLQRWTSELCKMVRYRGPTSDLEPNSPTTLHILSHMNYDVALIHTRSITIPSPSKIKKRV